VHRVKLKITYNPSQLDLPRPHTLLIWDPTRSHQKSGLLIITDHTDLKSKSIITKMLVVHKH